MYRMPRAALKVTNGRQANASSGGQIGLRHTDKRAGSATLLGSYRHDYGAYNYDAPCLKGHIFQLTSYSESQYDIIRKI